MHSTLTKSPGPKSSIRAAYRGTIGHPELPVCSKIRRLQANCDGRLGSCAKASDPAGTGFTRIMPQWRMGDRIRWQDKIGHFHRDLGDGNAEVTIANRAYRVRIGDLRPG